jgi:CheY-like chemotaxis protein
VVHAGTPYVLIIEPSQLLRRAVQSYCASKQVVVQAAEDVLGGLQQVQDEKPAGVILAVELDGFSCYSFLGAIRADPRFRDVPVAMFSSVDSSWFEESLLKPDHIVRKGPELEADVGAFLEVLGLLEEAQPNSGNELQGSCVLLVEDSELIQHALSVVLRKAGAHLHIASNGVEAIEMASKHDFDMVLMDIDMPVLNGVEATGILRSRGYTGVIVALTASEPEETRLRYDVSSFDSVLSKPERLPDLVANCAQILAGQRVRVAESA